MIKKHGLKSIRIKLLFTLGIVILMIISFFIIISNAILETLYKKKIRLRFMNM